MVSIQQVVTGSQSINNGTGHRDMQALCIYSQCSKCVRSITCNHNHYSATAASSPQVGHNFIHRPSACNLQNSINTTGSDVMLQGLSTLQLLISLKALSIEQCTQDGVCPYEQSPPCQLAVFRCWYCMSDAVLQFRRASVECQHRCRCTHWG